MSGTTRDEKDDPTANVMALVAAAERRLDDLRVEAERLSAIKHQHSRELIKIGAEHAKELREAETKRLDAIRAVDVAAASIIANQVATSAEALRALVATTATTLAAQTTTSNAQLSDRISSLERTSYEGSGRGAGMEKFWGWIVGGGALLYAVLNSTGKM